MSRLVKGPLVTTAALPARAPLLPLASARQTRRAVLGILAAQPWRLGFTIVASLAGSLAGLLIPAVLGHLVAIITADGADAELLGPVIALAAAGTLSAAGLAAARVLMARLCEGALATLREEVFRTALDLPLEQVEAAGIGDVVSRVAGDVDAVGDAISGVLPSVVAALFTVAVTVLGLGVLDWRFALAALVAVPVQAFALHRFLAASRPVYRQIRQAEGTRTHRVLTTVRHRHTVLALGTENDHLALVDGASRAAIELTLTGVTLMTRFYNRLNLAELAGLAAVLVTGFWLVAGDLASVAAATTAALFFHRLFDPIGTVLGQVDELQKAGAGLSRLLGISLNGRPAASPHQDATSSPPPPAPPHAERAGIDLELAEVSFDYANGHPAVRELSMRVRAGQHLALVGTSGAGKSTVARLIAGIHTPADGTLWVRGRPATGTETAGAQITPAGPLAVALVSQEVHVFAGTLAADLRLARPDATDEQLLQTLRAVHVDWLDELPEGLGTLVGAGGRALTAEQAQHLALARLLLADPLVAVLDEPTAESGSALAGRLDRATAAVLAGRTGITVAHRLSQAADADWILVLRAGRVVESGNHAELLAGHGEYARLWSEYRRGHGD